MIPQSFSLAAIQEAFRDLESKIKFLVGGNIDISQRRIINAGASVQPSDYVTKAELTALKTQAPKAQGINVLANGTFTTADIIVGAGGTTVKDSTIALPGTLFSGTVALAKLTGAGANGSLTVTNGFITAYTAPT